MMKTLVTFRQRRRWGVTKGEGDKKRPRNEDESMESTMIAHSSNARPSGRGGDA